MDDAQQHLTAAQVLLGEAGDAIVQALKAVDDARGQARAADAPDVFEYDEARRALLSALTAVLSAGLSLGDPPPT